MLGYGDNSFWDTLITYWNNGKRKEAERRRLVGDPEDDRSLHAVASAFALCWRHPNSKNVLKKEKKKSIGIGTIE